ncbi:hypothetical protein BX600DRAFT_279992 [Xylariales sp. PMI_506]|nr:hypothetical protein BX600DRAFT_279992 [Xylariales sp. PMI_506]
MVSQSIVGIRKHMNEMSDQLETLRYQEKLCNSIARELELHLALEDSRSTWIQMRTGENVRAITILALVCSLLHLCSAFQTFNSCSVQLVSPPSISAAIFSMNPGVLPFSPSLLGYLTTTFFLGGVIWISLRAFVKLSLWRTDKSIGISRPPPSYPGCRRVNATVEAPTFLRNDRYDMFSDEIELGELGNPQDPADML